MIDVKSILRLSREFINNAGFDRDHYGQLPPMNSEELENEELDDTVISTERLEYLSQFPKIGSGGDRTVYATSSKRALKVARNMGGITQNEVEFNILSKYSSSFLPKAFYHAEDYSWIEVELVRPLINENEIYDLIGIDGDLFVSLLRIKYRSQSFDQTIQKKINSLKFKLNNSFSDKIYIDKISKFSTYLGNQFLKELHELLFELNIDISELTILENLGKSASGHLVLLDVGRLIT